MTRQEAMQIPELQIIPDDLVEDCFYYKLAKAGKLSHEQGLKVKARLKEMRGDPRYRGAMAIASLMVENLEKYGVACAAWCKERTE